MRIATSVDAAADQRSRAARPEASQTDAAEAELRWWGCRAPAKLVAFVVLEHFPYRCALKTPIPYAEKQHSHVSSGSQ